jgi:MFS superfamily sulfate permease-like transporter
MKQGLFSNLKYDLPAGVVVFLVAVPLCLGIALASGAPLYSGMIAGIIGGIVVSCISNAHLSVSGPAAGLSAIVLASITQLGSFETFLLAVVFAGALQLILGIVKAGTIASYFPSNVIKGLLSAIGIIIILKQIPHAVGYDKDSEGDLGFLQLDGQNTFSEIFNAATRIDLGATLLAVLALGIIVLWERPFMKKHFKLIPGALVAVVVCTALNALFASTGSSLTVGGEHLVRIPVAGSFDQFIAQFTLPDFSQLANKQVYTIAVTIAIVASIETLLCIEAVDKLDPHRRVASPNRELIAQGAGNILSGLIGGLPMTSVIVRSSANINANAQTKMSAITHGVLILFCVALIPAVLNLIPLSVLAAILLVTGYKLAKISIFKDMFRKGKYQWIPFIITVAGIVFTDLLVGVGLGLAASVVAILRGNMKTSYFFNKEQYEQGDLITIRLAEEVSFLNKASIRLTLDHLPENSKVIIDASATTYIDYDVLEIIRDFRDTKAIEKKIQLQFTGFREAYQLPDNHLFITTPKNNNHAHTHKSNPIKSDAANGAAIPEGGQ